jgi:hypothetical protein
MRLKFGGKSCEGFEDLFGGLGPHERAGVGIPVADVGLQCLHALMGSAADLLFGREGETSVRPGSSTNCWSG